MSLGEVAALVGLGAFHGLNPGMGWLFAVAIGLQERGRAALVRAMGPIAAGHLVSIAVVAIAITVGVSATTSQVVSIVGGVALVCVGMWLLLRRKHFRWVGMRLTGLQLATWSFLMASVHGAGLMLVPVLAGEPVPEEHAHHVPEVGVGDAVVDGTLAALVHTSAMIAVAAVIALCVHEFLGLRILRSAWVNLDRVWAVVLVGAGAATCVAAVT